MDTLTLGTYYYPYFSRCSRRCSCVSSPPPPRDPLCELGWETQACLGVGAALQRYLPSNGLAPLARAPGAGHAPGGGRLGPRPKTRPWTAAGRASRWPARLPAPSPHSFVLARGSSRRRGPAAPPTRREAGLGSGAAWGRGRGAGRRLAGPGALCCAHPELGGLERKAGVPPGRRLQLRWTSGQGSLGWHSQRPTPLRSTATAATLQTPLFPGVFLVFPSLALLHSWSKKARPLNGYRNGLDLGGKEGSCLTLACGAHGFFFFKLILVSKVLWSKAQGYIYGQVSPALNHPRRCSCPCICESTSLRFQPRCWFPRVGFIPVFEGVQLSLFSVHDKPGIQLQRMLLDPRDPLSTGDSFGRCKKDRRRVLPRPLASI